MSCRRSSASRPNNSTNSIHCRERHQHVVILEQLDDVGRVNMAKLDRLNVARRENDVLIALRHQQQHIPASSGSLASSASMSLVRGSLDVNAIHQTGCARSPPYRRALRASPGASSCVGCRARRMRSRAKDRAAATPLWRACGTLASAARALLTIRLLVAAADLGARLGGGSTLAAVYQLRRHHLVQHAVLTGAPNT